MIARLRGRIWEKSFNRTVIDTGGVGYELQIPVSTSERMGEVGDGAELYVCTQVREDAIILYGFASLLEKSLFELLLTVSGIGGKLALSVLSGLPVTGFRGAVINRDLAVLSKIPGIGKRTAERLVVELRDKLLSAEWLGSTAGAAPAPDTPDSEAVNDAALALEQLGVKHDVALDALRKVEADIPEKERNSGNLLRLALQYINRKQ
ncbi:MAG: Holliday junction branch migration protein RuvA [Victivallaceae bacterium]|nr:Holliday junction branch migration protein RuvA [Victivallaceae bacterium]